MEIDTQKNTDTPKKQGKVASAPTPRRSARKSVMPLQDYDQIVNQKRILRSTGKEKNNTQISDVENGREKIRWTPAKVGRVSEKRSRKGRKSARRPTFEADQNQLKDADMLDLGLEFIGDEKETLPDDDKATPIVENLDEKENGDINNSLNSSKLMRDQKESIVDKNVEVINVEKLYADDTLNASDCVIVSPLAEDAIVKSGDEHNDDMESLQISDDEDTQMVALPTIPSVVVTEVENVDQDVNENDDKLIVVTTNKNHSKSTSPTISPKCLVDDTFHVENPQLSLTLPFVSMEPVEIVLRSIRKRSLSLCIGDANETRCKERRNVTFHSPANQTTVIEDLDVLIAQSIKKTTVEKNTDHVLNVTQRRKRSLSFSDASILSSKPINRKATPRKLERTPSKLASNSTAAAAKRTKLPNFAAIHEKQFSKMENLVDHMARKAERAKTISSATKIYPLKTGTTPSKEATPSKNLVNQSWKREENEKIKAMKRIEWTTPKKNESEVPKPKKLAIIKPLSSNATSTSQSKPMHFSHRPVNTSNKTKVPEIKLNTQANRNKKELPKLTAKSVLNASTSTTSVIQPTKPITLSASKLAKEQEDKIASRRQRHMDMFKGRSAAATRKADNVLRGVRSNRRFELQMQHRRNMEQK